MKLKMLGVICCVAMASVSGQALAAKATPEGSAIEIPAPPAGKGQIVFFRTGGMGFALGCSVNENGEKISSLGSGKYFVMVTDPGQHEYSVKSEAKDVLTLLVEPDETQYAKCRIKMGIIAGRPDIAPSTAEEFVKASTKLKLVDDDDMGPGPGALRAEELAAALVASDAPAVVKQAAETDTTGVADESVEPVVTETL